MTDDMREVGKFAGKDAVAAIVECDEGALAVQRRLEPENDAAIGAAGMGELYKGSGNRLPFVRQPGVCNDRAAPIRQHRLNGAAGRSFRCRIQCVCVIGGTLAQNGMQRLQHPRPLHQDGG
ncbi:hypothetical protein DEM27_12615 [Metarhizobium album]|uniref:Uncharacterized protein n=1 Tax=Metarhizobium album TaxID=2182425 RepID=A0A2U2DSI1_9HYPH|nr:hypothetical protein DEM27_12615 [Rhizobium album]